ncbi:MAG: ribosome biogenesis GTPase Der [Alphaproteobacteria bacterium]|nr:ribosome biogenesis GTPase Der [Alphaproteobacteria bacterium]
MSGFTVAIIGRPNVGKSTLFNRLVGKRLAIVDDTPGVTRDRREGDAKLGDLRFRIVDTAGLEDAQDDSLAGRMRRQTDLALAEADLALFLIDARAGVTPLDEYFADVLRRSDTPVRLIANKCEGAAGLPGLHESYRLGLKEPTAISAEHGEGLADLYQIVAEAMADWRERVAAESDWDEAASEPELGETLDPEALERALEADRPPPRMKLTIVGRPNVGKSTLVNRLLGEERLLTGPEAGVTRDSIAVDWSWRGRDMQLVDTAGMRRKARVSAKVERLSAADTRRAIQFSHVVVLLLDAQDMLEKQDLTIARQVLEEGRALVVAANKWDVVEDKAAALQKLKDRLQTSLPQAKGAPVVTLSAKTGDKLNKLLDASVKAYDLWNTRIPTGPLNKWLADVTEAHPPPLARGRRIRLRYATQAKTRPPTFVIFASMPETLPDSYNRYLVNALREDFNLPGVPLRLLIRRGANPYAPDDKGRGAPGKTGRRRR